MSINNIPEAIKLKVQKVLNSVPSSVLEEQKYRLHICNECEELDTTKILDIKTCGICGCVLELKTLVDSEHCPIKKW